jgi:hypothetical protein
LGQPKKTTLHLSEGDLGSILSVLPLGQLVVMPFLEN